MATKNELIASLEERSGELERLKEELLKAKNQGSAHKRDAERDNRNWKECEAKLAAIRQIVTAELKVRHGVELQPKVEWFQGQEVLQEEVTPEIRFLRHLFEVSNTQPPF